MRLLYMPQVTCIYFPILHLIEDTNDSLMYYIFGFHLTQVGIIDSFFVCDEVFFNLLSSKNA